MTVTSQHPGEGRPTRSYSRLHENPWWVKIWTFFFGGGKWANSDPDQNLLKWGWTFFCPLKVGRCFHPTDGDSFSVKTAESRVVFFFGGVYVMYRSVKRMEHDIFVHRIMFTYKYINACIHGVVFLFFLIFSYIFFFLMFFLKQNRPNSQIPTSKNARLVVSRKERYLNTARKQIGGSNPKNGGSAEIQGDPQWRFQDHWEPLCFFFSRFGFIGLPAPWLLGINFKGCIFFLPKVKHGDGLFHLQAWNNKDPPFFFQNNQLFYSESIRVRFVFLCSLRLWLIDKLEMWATSLWWVYHICKKGTLHNSYTPITWLISNIYIYIWCNSQQTRVYTWKKTSCLSISVKSIGFSNM